MPQYNHSAESWGIAAHKGMTYVHDKDGLVVGCFASLESAKRAAVCVNACTGIPTEALDGRRISWCVYSDIPQEEESHDTQ
jgi:hypothetical protein